MARVGIGAELEGVHAVTAAFRAGRVLELIVERSKISHPNIGELVREAGARGISVELVDDVRSRAATTAPQGILARARSLPTHDLDSLVEPSPCLLVVLDHLEDPHNVGAIARSASAAGATGLVVPARRAAPLGPTAFKAAAGALEHLRVSVQSSTAAAIQRLKRNEVWTVGLTAAGRESLFGLPLLSEPVALVIGGEATGLGRLTEERVDVVASIPMTGESESLNASVAAALAVFEAARVRGAL